MTDIVALLNRVVSDCRWLLPLAAVPSLTGKSLT
jgi:hypothetical protein